MKVLQINAVYNLSSTGRTTTELHLAMLNKGIDSYVAYSKTNKPGDARLYHIGSPLDVKPVSYTHLDEVFAKRIK